MLPFPRRILQKPCTSASIPASQPRTSTTMSSAVASTKGRTISGSLAEWSTRNKAHNKLIKASTKRVHDLYGLLRVWPKAGNVAIRDAYHQIVLEAGAHGPDDLVSLLTKPPSAPPSLLITFSRRSRDEKNTLFERSHVKIGPSASIF